MKKKETFNIKNLDKYRGKIVAWYKGKIIAYGKSYEEVERKVGDKKDKVTYESISQHEGMLIV